MLEGLNQPLIVADFETRSYLNVRDVGAWRYAEDETTEILCMAYKIIQPDGTVSETMLWVPELRDFPEDLAGLIESGAVVEAHNAQFERAIWIHVLHRRMGVPLPKQWRDTMAVCAHRSLPLGLDDAGRVLRLPIKKDKHGKYLLQTLTTPKWATKKEPDRIYREDFNLMQDLYDYCVQDVDAEHCLGETLGPLPESEYYVWVLDQRINTRGVQLDVEAVKAALAVIKQVEENLIEELRLLTSDEVSSASQVKRLLDWFRENGLPAMPNLTKDTIADLLDRRAKGQLNHVPEATMRVVEIRAELAKASTKKLVKMLDSVNKDGRIRGLLQYHGAGTGRWAGRLVQPQNFPRPTVVNAENAKGKKYLDMEKLVSDIKMRDPAYLYNNYPNPLEAISSSLRGMFIAKPGYELFVCDFSAIEARVTFWVAGCDTGLDVFHRSDRGEGEDIYCVTASDLVGFEVKKAMHSDERQLGKITVLGCGYQMGWSKLQFQAEKDYGVLLSDEDAEKMVNVYRDKYWEVKAAWYGLQDAALATVITGKPHHYKQIGFEYVTDQSGTWLTAVLPNTRRLWYREPRVEVVDTPWGKKDQVTYYGRNNKTGGSWSEIRTYGGMLMENIVQAIARDLMVEAMFRVEAENYPIILTVHDELIAEVLKGTLDYERFEYLMSRVPPWAEGCPVAVEGGVVERYQKV